MTAGLALSPRTLCTGGSSRLQRGENRPVPTYIQAHQIILSDYTGSPGLHRESLFQKGGG